MKLINLLLVLSLITLLAGCTQTPLSSAPDTESEADFSETAADFNENTNVTPVNDFSNNFSIIALAEAGPVHVCPISVW